MVLILTSELNKMNLKSFYCEGVQFSCQSVSFPRYPDGELDGTSWRSLCLLLKKASQPIVCIDSLNSDGLFPWILFLRTLHNLFPDAAVVFIATYLAYTRQALPQTNPALLLLRDTLSLFSRTHCFVVDPHQSLVSLGFESIELCDFYKTLLQQFSPSTSVLVSPDKGREHFVRVLSDQTHLPALFLNKSRTPKGIEITVDVSNNEENLHDKDVIILDDMIDSGATILSVMATLKKKDPRSFHLFITHWLLQKEKEDAFYDNLSQYALPIYLYRTNTVSCRPFPKNLSPYISCVTLDLSGEIQQCIQKILKKYVS